jgi:glycosyltransferase involved in cell wall biosynthesis
MKSSAYKKWSAYFERKILKSAERITTVAPFFKKQIEQNVTDKKFEILYNGYDPDVITAISGIEPCREELSIAFAGTIYDWHPTESFLAVCNELMRESQDFKLQLHFYGINKEEEVRMLLAERYQRLEQSTHFYPKQGNLELAKAISRQNVCLLFNDYSIIGTKIFDYLAVRRQIVLCYENDSDANELKKKFYQVDENQTESRRAQAEVIEATRSGIVARDAKHLKTILQELHDELRQCGSIECASVGVEEYSRLKQIEKLASLVRELHHSKKNH